jgi:hypothetical protein
MKIPFTTINIILTVACLFLLYPIIQETITDESSRAHNEFLKRHELEEAQVVAVKSRILKLKGNVCTNLLHLTLRLFEDADGSARGAKDCAGAASALRDVQWPDRDPWLHDRHAALPPAAV